MIPEKLESLINSVEHVAIARELTVLDVPVRKLLRVRAHYSNGGRLCLKCRLPQAIAFELAFSVTLLNPLFVEPYDLDRLTAIRVCYIDFSICILQEGWI